MEDCKARVATYILLDSIYDMYPLTPLHTLLTAPCTRRRELSDKIDKKIQEVATGNYYNQEIEEIQEELRRLTQNFAD